MVRNVYGYLINHQMRSHGCVSMKSFSIVVHLKHVKIDDHRGRPNAEAASRVHDRFRISLQDYADAPYRFWCLLFG